MPEQWVNLTRDAKWVGGPVTSIERCGPVRFKFTFKAAKDLVFEYRVIPDGENAKYSRKERGRNPGFHLRNGAGSAVLTGDRTMIRQVILPAAGGDKFKIEAKYSGKTKTSKEIESRRLLFYQSLPMATVAEGDTAKLEADMWKPANKYYVKLIQEGAGATITFKKTLDTTVLGPFLNDVKTGYALQARKPYAFVLVWCNYIASKKVKVVNKDIPVTLPAATAAFTGWTLTIPVGDFLWYGLDDTDDAAKSWFISLDLGFEDTATSSRQDIAVPDAKVTVGGNAIRALGGYASVKIALGNAELDALRDPTNPTPGKLVVALQVRAVNGFSNGFSVNGINVTAVAHKAAFEVREEAAKSQTVIHEIGHKIGMVSDGLGKKPNKPTTQYTGQNHTGSHCSKGATFTPPKTWSGDPGCVMFGESHAKRPGDFCDECAPIVRKLDLGKDMEGFARSVKD